MRFCEEEKGEEGGSQREEATEERSGDLIRFKKESYYLLLYYGTYGLVWCDKLTVRISAVFQREREREFKSPEVTEILSLDPDRSI